MHLGAWPGGSWLPWRAAPLLLCSCSCLVFKRLPQEWSYLSFHLLTCTMGFAPIKWTCTAFFRPRQLTDRAILADRQTQEKKGVCCASPVQTTIHVGGSIATEATSRSPSHCCPSSITTITSVCCHVSKVEKRLALSPAQEPPVMRSRRHC